MSRLQAGRSRGAEGAVRKNKKKIKQKQHREEDSKK